MPQPLSVGEVLRRRQTRARWLNNDTYAALALAAAAVAALVWANIGGSYVALWGTPAGVGVGNASLTMTLSEWVDEGVMTVFFFSVGLDVRRELTLGELNRLERAALPVAGALGGLVVPALIFLLITRGHDYSSAWGSVISTDTAFALGMLALVGPRNAPRLRVFLLALAVVDDIGALTTIAVFYTDHLNVVALLLAAAGLAGVWVLQRRGVWRVTPYLMLGVFTWVCTYESGVHATLAGVLLALLMPIYPQRGRDVKAATAFFRLYRQAPFPAGAKAVRDAVAHAVPLNQRLSQALPPWVNYLVVPLFALANAGVALSGDALGSAFTSSLTWGVIVGLVVGKVVGITAAAALVLRVLPASRAPGLDLPRIAGAAGLSGMGFTISLLVVGLAITDPAAQDEARVGVLTASILALGVGALIFRLGDRFAPLAEPQGLTLGRPVDHDRDHVRGPANDDGDTPVTVVVYTAMDDVYRRQTAEALREVSRRHGDRLRVAYRHHTTGDRDMASALVLEAADAQGAFWPMHDALVRTHDELDEDTLTAITDGLGLDAERLSDRVRGGEDQVRVDDDNLDACTAELPDHPVIYIDGRLMTEPANAWFVGQRVRAAVADAQRG